MYPKTHDIVIINPGVWRTVDGNEKFEIREKYRDSRPHTEPILHYSSNQPHDQSCQVMGNSVRWAPKTSIETLHTTLLRLQIPGHRRSEG